MKSVCKILTFAWMVVVVFSLRTPQETQATPSHDLASDINAYFTRLVAERGLGRQG